MKAQIQKWGNSLAVRIPQAFASETGLIQGSPVEMRIIEGKLVIAPVAPQKPTLAELLDQIRPENLHGEIDTGDSVGGEVW